jgi:Xaa-Pro aminopeptidase
MSARMQRFRTRMDSDHPDWAIALVLSKLNIYYFTGTMQEGMLIIPRGGEAVCWIRRSFERAADESLFPDIRPMGSYRDAAAEFDSLPGTVHLETEFVPLAMYQRIQKHFPFARFQGLDRQIAAVRAVKSPYELSLMRRSGCIHRHVLEDLVPAVLKEGMSEADLLSCVYSLLVAAGHQGVVRFTMFDTEMIVGHVAFGESSLYPTSFDGPGGNYGLCPAVPAMASRERTLRKGDLVFVDVGCGFDGYSTDKTMTYVFGSSLSDHAIDAHRRCVDIQNEIALRLKPGAVSSVIYEEIMASLSPGFRENFMGFGSRQAKFLGHGIGLTIDEYPVIAKGFDEPIVENMVFALEPKKGIPGIGMVGIENTFIVTPDGGECITGTNPGLLRV